CGGKTAQVITHPDPGVLWIGHEEARAAAVRDEQAGLGGGMGIVAHPADMGSLRAAASIASRSARACRTCAACGLRQFTCVLEVTLDDWRRLLGKSLERAGRAGLGLGLQETERFLVSLNLLLRIDTVEVRARVAQGIELLLMPRKHCGGNRHAGFACCRAQVIARSGMV